MSIFESSYSIPNIFIPILGGILADRYGYNKLFMINSILVMSGAFIKWLGVAKEQLWLIVLGTIVWGLGGENL